MKNRSPKLTLALSLCCAATASVFGQTINWVGIPGTLNGTNFGVTTNWSGGSPTTGTTCTFNGSVAGNVVAASSDGVDHTGSAIGGSYGASGINIEITGAQTSPVKIISSVAAATGMGLNGILVDAGAGQLTLGDTTANQLVCTLRPAGSTHTWENDSSHPVIINPSLQINNGGGSNGHLIDFLGTGDFAITNNLRFNNGPTYTHDLHWDNTGTTIWATGGVNDKYNNGVGNVVINSGTVIITSSGLLPSTAGANTLQNNGTLLTLDATAQADTLTRVISGSSPIQINNGTWTFSAANTYTGNTLLNGGELIAGSTENSASGPLGVGGTISFSGGTLGYSVNNTFDYSSRFSTANNQAFSIDTAGQNVAFTNATGLVSTGGTLTKLGSGTLTLVGANAYSGNTTISAGKLLFQGTLAGSGNLTVANSTTLGVTENGSQITPATLTVGTTAGATLEFNNVTSTTTAPLAATTIAAGGTITINVNSGTFIIGHSYPLFSWTSGATPAVALGTLTGAGGSLSISSKTVYLNITSIAYVWSGLNNGNWDNATANNWKVNGTAAVFQNNGTALFDDTATGATNITLSGAVQANATFNNSTLAYSLDSTSGSLSGGSLTKNGNSTLTLTGGANTYTGVTTLSGGILSLASLANGGSPSDIGAAANGAANLVLNGGTLQYTGGGATADHLFTLSSAGGTLDASGSGALVLSNPGVTALSGTGARTLTLTGSDASGDTLSAAIGDNGGATSLTKSGSGTWILTGNNTNSGATTIARGTLQIGTGTTGALGTGGIVNNGSLDINVSSTLTLGAITGTGSITNDGTGTLILPGNNTYSGPTTINAGTLQVGVGTATGALNANTAITDNGTFIFNSTSTLGLNGVISGTGNVIVKGNGGSLQAIAGNSATGWTEIDPGATFQPCRGNTGQLLSSVVTNNGTLLLIRQDAAVFGYSNNIVGSGSVVKENNNANVGTVVLAGTNTYTGGTFINGGGIVLGDGLTPLAGSIVGTVCFSNTISGNLNQRLLIFNRADDFVFTNNIISVVTDGSTRANSGTIEQSGPGMATITGSNNYPGGTIVDYGMVLQVGAGGTSGTIGSGSAINSGTLVFDRSDSLIISNLNGMISVTNADSSVSNAPAPGSVVQFGAGTLTLAGANTYTGSTVASNGTLVVTSGSVGGSVNVEGGVFAPASLSAGGSLTVASNLTIDAGTVLVALNKSLLPTTNIVVAGTLTRTGGSLLVTNVGSALAVGDKFYLFNQPVSGLAVSGAGATWQNNLAVDGSITVLTVPVTINPNAPVMQVSVSGTTLSLAWPTNRGWLLQTNSVGLTAKTQWFPYAGSSTLTNVNILIDHTKPAVFYRMVNTNTP